MSIIPPTSRIDRQRATELATRRKPASRYICPRCGKRVAGKPPLRSEVPDCLAHLGAGRSTSAWKLMGSLKIEGRMRWLVKISSTGGPSNDDTWNCVNDVTDLLRWRYGHRI